MTEPEGNGQGARGTGAGATAAAADPGEFQNFVADIEDLIGSMTSLTGEDLARARARLAERVEAAKETFADASGAVAERARDSARVANSFVHEHPWQAVGIGAVLGLLIGIAVSRRD